jgi:hypothetical protein
MKYNLSLLFILFCFACTAFAQSETLSNNEIILMTKAGLSRDLIVRKIVDSNGSFDTTAQALIELKKVGVADEVIVLMMDKKPLNQKENTSNENKQYSDSTDAHTAITLNLNQAVLPDSNSKPHIVLDPKEAIRSAKTIALEKSSANPSRQALEKELLKRKDWQKLNLNIVRYKESADLYVEIGFVPLSVITHRYVFRIYDRKSGTVIAAGETTSWGSLAENLARHITKKLSAAMN